MEIKKRHLEILFALLVVSVVGVPEIQGGSKKDSAPYFLNVIESLHEFHLADKILPVDKEQSPTKSELIDQNKRFQQGQKHMKRYLTSNDERRAVAEGMITGSQELIDYNQSRLTHLNDLEKNKDQSTALPPGQVKAYPTDCWGSIAYSAAWALGEIMGEPLNETHTGAIPYLISKSDRQQILKRIDRLFAEDLQFYESRVFAGHRGDTKDQTHVIGLIHAFRIYLSPDTYEEAEAYQARLREMREQTIK